MARMIFTFIGFFLCITKASAMCSLPNGVGRNVLTTSTYLINRSDFLGFVLRDVDKREGKKLRQQFIIIRSFKGKHSGRLLLDVYRDTDGNQPAGSSLPFIDLSIGESGLISLKSVDGEYRSNECLDVALRGVAPSLLAETLLEDAEPLLGSSRRTRGRHQLPALKSDDGE